MKSWPLPRYCLCILSTSDDFQGCMLCSNNAALHSMKCHTCQLQLYQQLGTRDFHPLLRANLQVGAEFESFVFNVLLLDVNSHCFLYFRWNICSSSPFSYVLPPLELNTYFFWEYLLLTVSLWYWETEVFTINKCNKSICEGVNNSFLCVIRTFLSCCPPSCLS